MMASELLQFILRETWKSEISAIRWIAIIHLIVHKSLKITYEQLGKLTGSIRSSVNVTSSECRAKILGISFISYSNISVSINMAVRTATQVEFLTGIMCVTAWCSFLLRATELQNLLTTQQRASLPFLHHHEHAHCCWFGLPHTPSCCQKYSLEHRVCFHPPPKETYEFCLLLEITKKRCQVIYSAERLLLPSRCVFIISSQSSQTLRCFRSPRSKLTLWLDEQLSASSPGSNVRNQCFCKPHIRLRLTSVPDVSYHYLLEWRRQRWCYYKTTRLPTGRL